MRSLWSAESENLNEDNDKSVVFVGNKRRAAERNDSRPRRAREERKEEERRIISGQDSAGQP